MALFGTLNQLALQATNHKLLKEGIWFLQSVNMAEIFNQITTEKNRTIEIIGKQLFAIFQTYDTKTIDALKFEGHRKYIDIQYIYSGYENLGVAGIDTVTQMNQYETSRDIHFSPVSHFSNWLMMPNDAAILFPTDMHAPGMAVNNIPTCVQKIVVKIAL